MPPVIRRRAVSPRGLQTTTVGTAPQGRGRCAALLRLSCFFGLIAGLVYLALGFQEAVDVATQKMQVLRSTGGSLNALSRSVSSAAKQGLRGLTTYEDVVEIVRPETDKKKSVVGNTVNLGASSDGEARTRVEDTRDAATADGKEDEDDDDEDADAEEDAHDEAKAEQKTMPLPARKVLEDPPKRASDSTPVVGVQSKEEPEEVVHVVKHEEDDAPAGDASKVVVEDHSTPASSETEIEEQLGNEEHAVDENAHDVVVEGAPEAEEGDDTEADSQDDESVSVPGGLQPIPKYKREELEERGFGHFLYAYRVVAPYVAIRTKPSPIGALALTSKDKMGLTKDSVKNGDIVVGFKLAKIHGLWLQIAPYTWAPVTKKDAAEGPFHPVMKQIRKITIPSNLRKYWRMPVVDCEAVYKKPESIAACHDKNMVRNGVLNVMRKMKLMDESMDPDVHPWPSSASSAATSARSTPHITSLTPESPAVMSDKNAGLIPSTSSSEQDDEEEKMVDDTQSNQAQPPPPPPLDETQQVVKSPVETVEAEKSDDAEEHFAEQSQLDQQQSQGGEEEEDDVDTDVECRQHKFWHVCARHAKCAWRRLPNQEYCDLDTDPPIDETTLPKELQQDSKYDFAESAKQKPMPKYFFYQPSGGWNNQRLLMESALIICKLLNRTCILPPAAPHSNYFNNYNNIPASAIVGMPRVINMEALNQVVSAVAVPRGVPFKKFLDEEFMQPGSKYTVKTVFRDGSKYKPGTMKKWGERDIIRMFGTDAADVIYFANQTLWGSVEWKGSMYGWPQRKQIQLAVMYPNHMKKIARKLADNLGVFHAVHIRRGDKVFETSFKRVYHDPEWYASRMAEHKSLAPKVYVATDEPNRSLFDAFKTYGFSMVFWESLPGYDVVLRPYLATFPKRMFMDVLGMIEQLLCSYATMFLGSGYSTFTTYILRLRKYRDTIATDTSFQDRALGLPEPIRNMKSSCDPIKALTHSKPC